MAQSRAAASLWHVCACRNCRAAGARLTLAARALSDFFNMALSMGVVAKEGTDPCMWYFINIMLDTTVRVLITYCMFRACETAIARNGWHEWKSGDCINHKGETNRGAA